MSDAPRVGLSTTMVEPGLTGGRLDGIGVYSNALLRHLPGAGVEVLPFSFAPPGQAARLTVGRALPLSYPLATLGDLILPSSVHLNVSRLAPAPLDLFHATDYRIMRMDCPVVATLHDALPICHPEWVRPRLRGLKNWLQAKAARKAQHVITGSHYSIRELVECFGVDERRISVVHHGVGAEWFETPAAAERSEDLVARLKAARQNGENVVWLDQLTDHAQLRHLYAGAGAFIFPSLYQGFGLPVVEAFASGVPVATSNATSLPEVAQGAALEFDPQSVPEMSAAMTALARDDALRARCIDAGRRRALELTWDEAARRTAAVYHGVLSQ